MAMRTNPAAMQQEPTQRKRRGAVEVIGFNSHADNLINKALTTKRLEGRLA
jgi:hypothetical protein